MLSGTIETASRAMAHKHTCSQNAQKNKMSPLKAQKALQVTAQWLANRIGAEATTATASVCV